VAAVPQASGAPAQKGEKKIMLPQGKPRADGGSTPKQSVQAQRGTHVTGAPSQGAVARPTHPPAGQAAHSLQRCSFCRTIGHKIDACEKLKQSKGSQCAFCGVDGHFMDACWRFEKMLASRTGGQDSAGGNRVAMGAPGNGLCY